MSKQIDIKKIVTLGDLKKSGYKSKSIKDEVRDNLIASIQNKENAFEGILGYEDTVIPDVERALLSRHNILFLGLRGQAKTRMARQMVDLLDEYMPTIAGSEVNDDPLQPLSRFAVDLIAEHGDETPIHWVHKTARYGEKLATPDVSVSDLIVSTVLSSFPFVITSLSLIPWIDSPKNVRFLNRRSCCLVSASVAVKVPSRLPGETWPTPPTTSTRIVRAVEKNTFSGALAGLGVI